MTTATQTAIDPKVVERIRKTLNLSRDGGATEAEAALAAELAQKLMRKYNLTLAEVESTAGEGGEGSKRTKEDRKGHAMYQYQQDLMLACAEVNFCLVMTVDEYRRGGGRRSTGFTVIGREANVISTNGLFDYLNSTLERLAFEYLGRDHKQRLSRAAVSFKTGGAERLCERLRERHQAALKEQAREARERSAATRHPGASSSGTALVVTLSNFAQVEQWRNEDLRWGHPEGTTERRMKEGQLRDALVLAAMSAVKGSAAVDREVLLAQALHAIKDLPAASDRQRQMVAEQVVGYLMGARERQATLDAETPAQRKQREERQQRENERFWRRQDREDYERESRIDHGARYAGRSAAANVGLDKQVKHSNTSSTKSLS